MIWYIRWSFFFRNSESFYRSAAIKLRSAPAFSCIAEIPKGNVIKSPLGILIHYRSLFSCIYQFQICNIINISFSLLEKTLKCFWINLCLAAPLFWGVFLYKLLFNLDESLCFVLKPIFWLIILFYILHLLKICCPCFSKFLHLPSHGKLEFFLTSQEGGTV